MKPTKSRRMGSLEPAAWPDDGKPSPTAAASASYDRTGSPRVWLERLRSRESAMYKEKTGVPKRWPPDGLSEAQRRPLGRRRRRADRSRALRSDRSKQNERSDVALHSWRSSASATSTQLTGAAPDTLTNRPRRSTMIGDIPCSCKCKAKTWGKLPIVISTACAGSCGSPLIVVYKSRRRFSKLSFFPASRQN